MKAVLSKRVVYLTIACAVVIGLALEAININRTGEHTTKQSTQLEYLAGPQDGSGG